MTTQHNTTRSAWLMENGKPQGGGLKYLTMREGAFEWTEDVHEALHLSRRRDAEKLSEECEEVWKIIEHGFSD